jgi:tetratricopeptide (TPR) repeat protein
MKKIILFFIFIFSLYFSYGQEIDIEKNKLYLDAIDLYFEYQYDSAIIKFEEIYSVYSDDDNLNFLLGMCYFFKGDFEKAILHYKQSLNIVFYIDRYQINKYSPEIVYFYLGFAYEKIEDYNNAIYYYESYIETEKDENIIYNTEKRINLLKIKYNID